VFLKSVNQKLRADVPVVSYLSGGVDSSIVVALAGKVLGRPIPTFTIGIGDDPSLNEETEAAIVAGKLYPFRCPIVDQEGKTVECKGGDHLDDGQVLGMNFYVKGVDDKIPGK